MRRIIVTLCYISLLMLLISCDYFGSFDFVIINKTDKQVVLSYVEQIRNLEDILPTDENGVDFHRIRLPQSDSTIIIHAYGSFNLTYEIGMVNKDFPQDRDTPRNWGVVPLWERITCLVVGTDTLKENYYSESKWKKDGSKYTLDIE